MGEWVPPHSSGAIRDAFATLMSVYEIDPCADARWLDFVQHHGDATAFHHPGWLRALQETYGYAPVALTTTSPGRPLQNGWAFCRVQSLLTGKRMVSLPFSDHAAPLVQSDREAVELAQAAVDRWSGRGLKYIEMRPIAAEEWAERAGLGVSTRTRLHQLDLHPSEEDIFKAFHDSSIKRKIKRAEREALRCEVGSSDALLDDFYRLMVMTRRKHGLPPQPRAWFRAVLDHLPEIAQVHVAYKDTVPAAAIFTCAFGTRYIYKYGASDSEQTNTGGTPLLFWRAIQDAKSRGFTWFDMGRTDLGHDGLATFKERFGAESVPIEYYRWPAPTEASHEGPGRLSTLAKPVIDRLPDSLLIAAGRILYRHMG